MKADILIFDLSTGQSTSRPPADPLAGGRLLTAQLVTELVDLLADPLGPGNILALAAGPLAGMRVSTAGRLSVGAKSPLTRGIKEANAGGMAADSLASLGYRALVLTGARPEGQPAVLILDEAGPRLADGRPYRGLGNEATAAALRAAFGAGYVVVSIGPAGEAQLAAAGIAVTDANDQPFRLAARGGLGAVMGSKGLKAILIRRVAGGVKAPAGGRSAITGFHKLVATSARITVLRDYGTASTVMLTQNLGALPTRNFSEGRFDGAEAISGETLRDLTLSRGGVGTPTEACMAGCVIQCSNVFPDAAGGLAVAPLEFETLGLCGSNLGLASLDAIARINRLCNDLGLDTIEIGAALGVMMEAAESGQVPPFARDALPRFSDGERAAEIVAEIRQGGRLGMLLGRGVVAVGQALGVQRVPAVKGQAMSAYDPRVIKGTGVTYATSPQGADHTAGLTVFAPVNHLDPAGAVALSRTVQVQRAAYDALGLCVFNLAASGPRPDVILEMLNNVYGVELPAGWLNELGRRVIDAERAFNRAAGFTPADDRLPAFFAQERLAATGSVFDVSEEALDGMWE
ncbi:MAG: aldehyde ferredoxin oxidoreductase [Chloroflexi bacterium]|nr:aldehyde ferredoxin oxidoreductase [Chloroflexota bacterium]